MLATDQISNSNFRNYEWIKVYRSETRGGTFFDIAPLKITASKLCSGQYGLPIKFQLMQYVSNGSHKYKGETYMTVNDFVTSGVRQWTLKNPKTNSKVAGLVLGNFTKEINYAFVDYLRGGIDINLITCIDFTGSNGMPTSPSSLHYMPNRVDAPLNQYQQAIQSVGTILLEYD